MKIALIVNETKPPALICAKEIYELLRHEGAEILALSDTGSCLDLPAASFYDDTGELISHCDYVVTVGGDGTIIHSAKYAAIYSKPILGVNLGRLGYVAELEASEISMLTRLLSDDYTIIKRMLLEVDVIHKDNSREHHLCVNDVVLSRGSLSRIIELEVSVEGEKIANYRADGLLFSTPTGSTAYALSAGGPVIDPRLKLIELTPVCPHSLTARTVLFTDDTVLSVRCKSEDTVYLTIDGQISVSVDPSDTVVVKRAGYELETIVLKDKNFYKTAGEKLREGDKEI